MSTVKNSGDYTYTKKKKIRKPWKVERRGQTSRDLADNETTQ